MKPVICKRRNNRGLLYDPARTQHRPSKTNRQLRRAVAANSRLNKRLAEGWGAQTYVCYGAEMAAGHYIDPETIEEVA